MAAEEVVLVVRRQNAEGETIQRSIEATYDPTCKLVQFSQYGEEVFGTLEPIEPEEWQEIVERLGRAAPFMRRVLGLVQEVDRIAEAAAGGPISKDLRRATERFAGAIEPEEVVAVAHAADYVFTRDEIATLEQVIDQALDRGVPEMQIAHDFGVVLGQHTEATKRPPSPQELAEGAAEAVRAAAQTARRAGVSQEQIEKEASR